MAAAAAQARRRQVAEVAAAFRAAGATAPDRARGLDAVLTGHAGEVRQLAEAGVLVTAPAGGRWYLDEAALAAWEEAQRRRGRRYALTAIAAIPLVAGLLVLLALGIVASRHP